MVKSKQIVAIDIGNYSIKIVEVRGNQVLNFGYREIDPSLEGEERRIAWRQSIASLLEVVKPKARNVILTFSSVNIFIRNLTYPPIPEEDLWVVMEKDAHLHLPPSQNRVIFDFSLKNERQEEREYQVVYCNALHYYSNRPDRLLKKKGRPPSGDIFPYLLYSSLINLNTMMFRREIFERGFMFGEGVYGRYSEEWELYLKVSRAGYRFGYIDEDLVVVEIRPDSNTQWETQWIIKKNTVEMFEDMATTMNDSEKRIFQVDKILRKHRIKLGVAYLIAGRKRDFIKLQF
mgnify:CR=1 FL=1